MTATAYPFISEGKALDATELQTGDLELRGYAAVWSGLDAQGENFLRGAFREAIPKALARGLPLAFHHDGSKVLGRVLELEEDDYGVKIRARVDRQERTSPLYWIYDAIRRGSIRGLSAGGYFERAATAAGRMIAKVLRLTEVSATAVAQHPLTAFQATEVKARMDGSAERIARLRYERDLFRDLSRTMSALATELRIADLRNSARARGLSPV